MNKKIFLTSMVALMVACPAYAVHYDPSANDPNRSGYIDTNDQSADCDTLPLTYNGSSPQYGTYYLAAQWDKDECTITLDPNNGATTATGGDSSQNTTNGYNKTLYTRYLDGAYSDANRTQAYSLGVYVPDSLPPAQGISPIPVGVNVTLTLDSNNPNTVSDIVLDTTGYNMSGRRPFTGFYGTGAYASTQYMIPSGAKAYITSAGDTIAKGLYKSVQDPTDGEYHCPNTVWYAHYGCVQTTFPNASKPGYVFDGWWTQASGGSQVQSNSNDACITEDTTLHAHWNPLSYGIVYQCNCGNGADCTGNPPTDNNTYTVESTNVSLLANPANSGCEWTDHSFRGWNCKRSDNNASVSTSGTYPNLTIPTMPAMAQGSNVICEGDWDGAFRIIYACGDGASGTAPTDSNTYNSSSSWSLFTSPTAGSGTCSKYGYSFVGWKCNYNIANGNSYTGTTANYPLNNNAITGGSGNSYGVNGNTTCTAIWEQNTVNLDWTTLNGGTLDTSAQSYQAGSTTCGWGDTGTVDVPYPAPTRTGYTFTGWKVINHTN